MNPDIFFENFDLLAESPNGIQKLREMILQMAVQGKLVEQDPDYEPAEVLLERIMVEKERLVKEGKIRKSKALPPIEEDEISYYLPDNWKWVRLGEIIELISGQDRTPSEYNGEGIGIPYITGASNIQQNDLIINRWIAKSNTIAIKDDLLITCKGTVGTTIILENEQVHIARQIMSVRSHGLNNIKYIKVFIDGYVSFLVSSAKSLIPGISRNDILNIVFPLPPLEEQKRIVAKVDQLMALCDQLESLQQKKNESRIQLNNSALNKMLDAGSPEEFAEHWQLVCENFDLLYDDLDNLEMLRQEILQLAVQGKLVVQDGSDEPAGVLLEKIKAEKERLVKECKIKKSKALPKLKEDEIPYEIPKSWKWIRLGDMIQSMTNGIYKPAKYYSEDGIACLRMYNINSGKINLINLKRMLLDKSELEQYGLEKGDLLVNRVNSRELVGKAGVFEDIQEPCIFESKNIRVRLMERTALQHYVNFLFQTSNVRKVFEGDAKQTCGQASINQPQIANIPLPLPPIEEQRRIVSKVNQLIELCDQLEAKVKQTQSAGELMVEAVASNLLET
ncbi:restriction endonuclease subunit S [Methanococcoides methylutens]|uniref:restriction endonuclease subunit S n=1 Tax=Methanococcoides methylutens TaxID=2226 RepID=UPI00064EB8CF|nr:restriction endonuclease subunit S [Methanococcoides methylutens]